MSDEKMNSRLNFRVADTFRAKVAMLAAASGHEVSDICRFGLLACWADIEAMVLAHTGQLPMEPEKVQELRDLIELCRAARARGVDLRKALTDALEATLSAEAAPAA